MKLVLKLLRTVILSSLFFPAVTQAQTWFSHRAGAGDAAAKVMKGFPKITHSAYASAAFCARFFSDPRADAPELKAFLKAVRADTKRGFFDRYTDSGIETVLASLDTPEYTFDVSQERFVQENGWQLFCHINFNTGLSGESLEADRLSIAKAMAKGLSKEFPLSALTVREADEYGDLGYKSLVFKIAGKNPRDCIVELAFLVWPESPAFAIEFIETTLDGGPCDRPSVLLE